MSDSESGSSSVEKEVTEKDDEIEEPSKTWTDLVSKFVLVVLNFNNSFFLKPGFNRCIVSSLRSCEME